MINRAVERIQGELQGRFFPFTNCEARLTQGDVLVPALGLLPLTRKGFFFKVELVVIQ